MKILRKTLWSIVGIAAALLLLFFILMIIPQFGKAPSGKRLARIEASAHYKNGRFHNLEYTPMFVEQSDNKSVFPKFLFKSKKNLRPAAQLPSIKTKLKDLPPEQNFLVWFGHSSYYFQLEGKRFLVDPVLGRRASPVPGMLRAFPGSVVFKPEDLPPIDYLLITHDHYDHLDYRTIKKLKGKVGMVVCGLGVGSHLSYWGYPASKIIEMDWTENLMLDDKICLYIETSRHFSGRFLSRNNTLWLSFVIKTPDFSLFIGGDGGYGCHVAAIGKKHGPFDLAVLENGQYNALWRNIHNFPEDVLLSAKDLHAQRVLPVHSGKFSLAFHPWNEPLTRLSELNQHSSEPVSLVTPLIGEVVKLDDPGQSFTEWWQELE